MKVFAVALFACLAAVVLSGEIEAEGYGGYGRAHHYEPGFRHTHDGIAAAYRNDARQEHVNHVAEHYGSGTGTARFVGVPGTNGYYGYGHHGYGHGYGYGNGYGYDGAYGGEYNHEYNRGYNGPYGEHNYGGVDRAYGRY